jgi:hypothetical protein
MPVYPVPPHCPQCVCAAPGEEIVVVAGLEVVVGADFEVVVVAGFEVVVGEDLVVEAEEVEEEDGGEGPLPVPLKVDPISPQRILEYVT